MFFTNIKRIYENFLFFLAKLGEKWVQKWHILYGICYCGQGRGWGRQSLLFWFHLTVLNPPSHEQKCPEQRSISNVRLKYATWPSLLLPKHGNMKQIPIHKFTGQPSNSVLGRASLIQKWWLLAPVSLDTTPLCLRIIDMVINYHNIYSVCASASEGICIGRIAPV